MSFVIYKLCEKWIEMRFFQNFEAVIWKFYTFFYWFGDLILNWFRFTYCSELMGSLKSFNRIVLPFFKRSVNCNISFAIFICEWNELIAWTDIFNLTYFIQYRKLIAFNISKFFLNLSISGIFKQGKFTLKALIIFHPVDIVTLF